MDRDLTALTAAVAVHVALSVAHGVVHVATPVTTVTWHAAYAAVVLVAAPLAGLAAARRGPLHGGAVLVAASAAAGLAFEGPWHFLLRNPDHVAQVTAARTAFLATAALSTAGDALATAVAGWIWWRSVG